MSEYIKKEDIVGLINAGIQTFDLALKSVTFEPTITRLRIQKGFLEELLSDIKDLKTVTTKPKAV